MIAQKAVRHANALAGQHEVDEPSDQIVNVDQEENQLAVVEPINLDRQKDLKRNRIGLKYSTAAKHPNGLSEKEIRIQKQLEKPVGRKYKKKGRWQLSSADIEKILEAYSEGDQT